MSISGSLLRASTATQAAQTASPAASRPSVRAEPHPQVVVSLIATRTAEMPALIDPAIRAKDWTGLILLDVPLEGANVTVYRQTGSGHLQPPFHPPIFLGRKWGDRGG